MVRTLGVKIHHLFQRVQLMYHQLIPLQMDRVSIVGDAIEYIKELETNVQDELKRLEDNDSKSHEDEVEVCKPKRGNAILSPDQRLEKRGITTMSWLRFQSRFVPADLGSLELN
ncbi:hypothetical protein Ccrd_000849 [Cynara cardunculus var. scolymus]|uniref:Myc-type, basic helix-loop-helix (BHLH) domain-containing protein n=1 Tax=Cynara cardunculus var. scolymus TaxID=59895 RepID=A0A103XUE4_CYNCS|nr:hypothetical protein Ccrd_000849 [Cynara cardunculus var. scolymus]